MNPPMSDKDYILLLESLILDAQGEESIVDRCGPLYNITKMAEDIKQRYQESGEQLPPFWHDDCGDCERCTPSYLRD